MTTIANQTMLLLHEDLQREAWAIEDALHGIYTIRTATKKASLDCFPQIEGKHQFNPNSLEEHFHDQKLPLLLLTAHDLYLGVHGDDWIFAGTSGRFHAVSTARLQQEKHKSGSEYLEQIAYLAAHEIGHQLIRAPHHTRAIWVSEQTGRTRNLGLHCDDARCLMYPDVDVQTPKNGYLLLGRRRYDAGLEEHVARLYDSFLCTRCESALDVPDTYTG